MKSVIITLLLLVGIVAGRAGISGQLEDATVAWRWQVVGGKIWPVTVDDKLDGLTLALTGECFQLVLGDGSVVKASDFIMDGVPEEKPLAVDLGSLTQALHFPGRQLVVKFSDPKQNLSAEWRVILRDGSDYVRQVLALTATGKDVLIQKIILLDEKVPGAKTDGITNGSPVVAGNFYLGYEFPMAQNMVDSADQVQCSYLRNAVLKAGETMTQSCVIGVAPTGQIRRSFLAYIERERPRPYQPFLHYNSWFDRVADRKYDEAGCLQVINTFGQELVQKRGVQFDSFLYDDGWDNTQTLWKINDQTFPNGFTPLQDAAAKYGAGIGLWLSPFGGYFQDKANRLKYGAEQGYEINAHGLSLTGPNYYRCFHDICLEMIQQHGVNTFKFDGIVINTKKPDDGAMREGEAMMRLNNDLRAAKPSIYINQTTGTWPSPFWLLNVDSIWRGGGDTAFLGKGSECQRMITYRDSSAYKLQKNGPLFPLNSVMLHGVVDAMHLHLGKNPPNDHGMRMSDEDFTSQVRVFFGTGTQVQEMYVTFELMNKQNWDDLAEAAKWARTNTDVLVDTHWIGGDPGKGDIYGWASWSPKKAIIELRNPDDKPGTFTADVKDLFELPTGARTTYVMQSPWKNDANQPSEELQAGQPHQFTLQPFQLLILEETSKK